MVTDDCPPIEDDILGSGLMTQREVAEIFGYQPGRVREWMRGVVGKKKNLPRLPYVRVGKTVYFSRRQIAWWLRQLQEEVDEAMVDVNRAHRQQGT